MDVTDYKRQENLIQKNQKEAQSAVDFLNVSDYVSQIWKLNQQVLALVHHLLRQHFNKLQVLAWDLALKKQ